MTSPRAFFGRAFRVWKLATAFLTILPLRNEANEATLKADLEWSRFAFPIVGLQIGLGLAALNQVLAQVHISQNLGAFLLVLAGAIVTGGLHLDGLADTADGLFLWGDREKRLAVMREPQVGSYGVVAVVLAILGRYVLLADMHTGWRSMAVVGAAVVGRCLILVSSGMAVYARPEGTGRILIEATTLRDGVLASFVIQSTAFLVARGPGLIAGALAILLTWGSTRLASARLGGVTGDILGALVELGELTFLLTLVLFGFGH